MKGFRGLIFSVLVVLFLLSLMFLYWFIKNDTVEENFYFDFNEKEVVVFDDDGFPSVKFSFNCSNFVKIKVVDSDSDVLDIDYFLGGDDKEAVMRLGAYRQTISDSVYSIDFYDVSNKNIYSKEITFKAGDVDILDCDIYSWNKSSSEKYVMGLNLELENKGELPVYPNKIQFNNKQGFALPDVLNPYEKTSVDCMSLFKINEDIKSFNVSVYNSKDNLLASNFFDDTSFFEIDEKNFVNFSCNDSVLSLPYPVFLYDYYKNQDRVNTEDYSVYVLDGYDDDFIDLISELIIECYPGGSTGFYSTSDEGKINYIASFVQHIPYTSDIEETGLEEYPKFPIETLFDNSCGGGDCEDKAILTSSFLDSLGYNLTLIKFSNHMGLGVQLEKNAVPDKSYFVSDYYYLETSSTGVNGSSGNGGFELGEVPVNYTASMVVDLFEISPRFVMNHFWKENSLTVFKNSPLGHLVKVSLIVENLGLSAAEDIQIQGIIYDNDSFFEDYIVSNYETEYISYLTAGDKKEVNLIVEIESGNHWYFKTEVLIDGSTKDTVESERTFSI